eukprot:gnl/MRDRNA2_/MRDRNA2_86462_c0_seq1.p1 gnl/MRDRNA2_/MRDRNA2_86462_c0~~gnl/MRDRNA2_/MRDRNA2_86462_c0_seq1.p1  ORF type:complete len:114 (+),score=14.99 gnl/MRDRNA2_/MRDRNA2_86462_c0_seq1:741-1082(+)
MSNTAWAFATLCLWPSLMDSIFVAASKRIHHLTWPEAHAYQWVVWTSDRMDFGWAVLGSWEEITGSEEDMAALWTSLWMHCHWCRDYHGEERLHGMLGDGAETYGSVDLSLWR